MSEHRIESNTPSDSDNLNKSTNWKIGAWVVLGLSAFLFLIRLGDRAIWSSEYRWAEIAREMIKTGNYFWPTLDGHVYYDKPLGTYWLVVASTWVSGGMNELAARLPCAIAGILAVAFLILIVRRLYDGRTAVWAGFILATSFSFTFFSRTASADVETITGELAALLLFLRYENEPDGWWVIGLWLIMAVTSQMKGLLGFVLPIMVIGSYATLANGWTDFGRGFLEGSLASRARWVMKRNRWLFNWRTLIGVVLGFAVYLIPFEISQIVMRSDNGLYEVFRENIVRFFHPFDHRGPVYLYVYVIFALMAPWSLMLPAALVHTHRRRHIGLEDHDRSDRFVLVFFWSTFVFFTLSGSRRDYYLLPILPAAAILVSRLLNAPSKESLSLWTRRLLVWGFALFTVIVAFGFITMLPPSWILPGRLAGLPHAPGRIWFGIFWIVSVIAVLYTLRKFNLNRVAVSLGIVAYLVMIYIYAIAMPAADVYRPEKPFAEAIVKRFGRYPAGMVFYKTQEGLFYIDPPKPIPFYKYPKAFHRALKEGKVRLIVVARRNIPSIGVPTKIIMQEKYFKWQSENRFRNQVLLLKVLPPAAKESGKKTGANPGGGESPSS